MKLPTFHHFFNLKEQQFHMVQLNTPTTNNNKKPFRSDEGMHQKKLSTWKQLQTRYP